jgi:hypothetical protein
MIAFPAARSAYLTHSGRKRSYPRYTRAEMFRDLDAYADAQLYLWANPRSKVCIEVDQATLRSLVHRPRVPDERPAPLLVVVPRDGIVILTINPGGRWPRRSPWHRDKIVPERVR